MRPGLQPLNSKDLKPMFKYIEDRWGVDLKPEGYAYFISVRNNVYLASRDVDVIDLKQLHVNNIGSYVWEWHRDEARLSIEGSQLVGPKAKRHVIKLDDGLFTLWIAGHDLQFAYAEPGYVIMEHNGDFVGCGRALGDKIMNFVPKTRRLVKDD
jgi:NOL1/NOP2/fmu family ribosome biogenesis protein